MGKDEEAGGAETPGPSKSGMKVAIGLVVAVALIAASKFLPVTVWLKSFLTWTEGLGPLGPAVLAGVYVLACVLFLPGSILTLGAGAAFGFVKGLIAVSIGSTLGACAAFMVGRTVARDWVAEKVAENPKLAALDEAVGREGRKIVFLTRLSPVFPFNLLNFFYGVTRVPLADYALASWIGMLPGTIVYVLIGSTGRGLAEAATGETDMLKNGLLVVGLIATVVVTGYVSRLAKSSLDQAIDSAEDGVVTEGAE